MPLLKSKSKKAFGKNVETEMKAGKPQKQSIAIAYSMKKKAQKMSKGGNPYSKMEESQRPNMASGGMVKSGDPEMDYADGGTVEETPSQAGSGPEIQCPHCQKSFAHGGFIGSYQSSSDGDCNAELSDPDNELSGYAEESAPMSSPNEHGLTDSGEQTEAHEMDMVGRAMKRRGMQMLSKGGKVANSDKPVADGLKAEYDDLHLRDDLDFEYTGANSGDEDGDHRSHEADDLVSRAMLKKKAKR